jgi:chromosome segregation ATPase
MSKARVLVKESVKIQQQLTSQLDLSSFSRAAVRMADGRSPVSGVSDFIPNFDDSEAKLQDFETKEALKRPSRLNPRILEAWINNTISDAEQIELPDELVTSEIRQPLIRFGVDRQSLINAGVPSAEVDRVFRALFVYSIGFYQLINKAMGHVANKNVLVAGIWKVYSILLEYCCYKDYQMVVKTLVLEREQEVARIGDEFRQQLDVLAKNESFLLENLEELREQLNQAQGLLVQETHRREELEEEMKQRGSGHEQEVELRLKFESKLNQMFAQQRDLEVRLSQQQTQLKHTQSQLEEKYQLIDVTAKKFSALQAIKQEQDIVVANLERSLAQQTLATKSAEQKIGDTDKKSEYLNDQLAKAREGQQNTLADSISKNLTIDRLQSEARIASTAVRRIENELVVLMEARKVAELKISEVEAESAVLTTKLNSLEAELVVSTARVLFQDKELKSYKKEIADLTEKYATARDKHIHLSQDLETKLLVMDELQKQLQHVLEGVNEATKGRKIAEEKVRFLERRQTELVLDLDSVEKAIVAEKHETDRLSSRIKELETDLEFAGAQADATEKQTASQREALLAKIQSLTKIAVAEKETRNLWIGKYEQEQKVHNEVLKELLALRQSTKDLELSTSDFSVKLQQANLKVETEQLTTKQVTELNYTMRGDLDELRREYEAQVEFNKLSESNFTRKLGEQESYIADQLTACEFKMALAKALLSDAESLQLQLWSRLREEEGVVKTLRTELRDVTREKNGYFKELESTRGRDTRGRMRIEEMMVRIGNLSLELKDTLKQRGSTDKLLGRTQAELIMYKNVGTM